MNNKAQPQGIPCWIPVHTQRRSQSAQSEAATHPGQRGAQDQSDLIEVTL